MLLIETETEFEYLIVQSIQITNTDNHQPVLQSSFGMSLDVSYLLYCNNNYPEKSPV